MSRNMDIDRIIKDAVTSRSAGANEYGSGTGLLLPSDAEKFITEDIPESPLYNAMSKEIVSRKSGILSLLGVTNRNLRAKHENFNNISGSEIKPVIAERRYNCRDVTLGTEISKDWYRNNIEREDFEDTFLNITAKQIKVDIADLAFNGDDEVEVVDGDSRFVSIKDGFIKKFKKELPKPQIVNASSINSGFFSDEVFYKLYRAIPERYRNKSALRWICSSTTQVNFTEWMKTRNTAVGDAALIGTQTAFAPLGIPFMEGINFPDNIIILTKPENLRIVSSYDIEYERTSAGQTLVGKQNIFYAWFLDLDFVTVNPNAAAMAVNVGTFGAPQAFLVANTDFEEPKAPEKKEVSLPPLVTNVSPHEGAINIAKDSSITISYNTEIEIAEESFITLQDITKKNPINIEIDVLADGKNLIVVPKTELTASHVYKVIAGIGAISRKDNAEIVTKKAEASSFEIRGNANPPQMPSNSEAFDIN